MRALNEEGYAMFVDFDKAGGLVPAIAQDADTGEVLMLAWMNRDAFEETVRSKRAVTDLSRRRGWNVGARRHASS